MGMRHGRGIAGSQEWRGSEELLIKFMSSASLKISLACTAVNQRRAKSTARSNASCELDIALHYCV